MMKRMSLVPLLLVCAIVVPAANAAASAHVVIVNADDPGEGR